MNHEEELKKFLDNGGEIEVLPPEDYEDKHVVGSVSKKTPEILTLEQGRILYGQRRQNKKDKPIDLSDIDMSLIPDDICKLVGCNKQTKEDTNETN